MTMKDFPAWAEQTDPASLAEGAWYVWYSEEPNRGIRSIIHAFTSGFRHQSPSANEEAARKIASSINNAYWMGRSDATTVDELQRSGRMRTHINKSHADGVCGCHPAVIAQDVPVQPRLPVVPDAPRRGSGWGT